jgi:hypothetical protein
MAETRKLRYLGNMNSVSLTVPRELETVAGSTEINGVVPRAGFEHATTRSSAERSPRLSYLGTFPGTLTSKMM